MSPAAMHRQMSSAAMHRLESSAAMHRQPQHFPKQVSLMAIREGAADLLVQLLTVASPDIRAAAVFGLGCLVHSCPEGVPGSEAGSGGGSADHPLNMTPTEDRLPAEQLIANAVRQVSCVPGVPTIYRGL